MIRVMLQERQQLQYERQQQQRNGGYGVAPPLLPGRRCSNREDNMVGGSGRYNGNDVGVVMRNVCGSPTPPLLPAIIQNATL